MIKKEKPPENNYQIKDLDNIVTKMKMYLTRNKTTLNNVANTMNFSVHPFYRLMNKISFPNITSIYSIAEFLECTISELMSDDVFLDISCYDSYTKFVNKTQKKLEKFRVYLPYESISSLLQENFFAVHLKLAIKPDKNKLHYELFYSVDHITSVGVYLVKYKQEICLINVITVRRNYIIIEPEPKEIQLNDIQVIAKFFNDFVVQSENFTQLVAKKL